MFYSSYARENLKSLHLLIESLQKSHSPTADFSSQNGSEHHNTLIFIAMFYYYNSMCSEQFQTVQAYRNILSAQLSISYIDLQC